MSKIKTAIGAAEIRLELKNNLITIYHCESNKILKQWQASADTWSELIDKIYTFMDEVIKL